MSEHRITRSLVRPCEAPGCTRAATDRVNLTCLSEYMAKIVCPEHADWAEERLWAHVPTDR